MARDQFSTITNAHTRRLRPSCAMYARFPQSSWEVAEAALAHRLGDAVAQAYARSDLFEQRRTLMQLWADYLTESYAGNI